MISGDWPAGLGLFLFGMHQREESLKLLAGRSFKKFLREHTAHPVKRVLAGIVSTAAQEFFTSLDRLRGIEQPSHRFENLVELKNKNESLHATMHADIYQEVAIDALSEVQISTLLNVNRELLSANQSLLAALADVLLDLESAADYESIPVSI